MRVSVADSSSGAPGTALSFSPRISPNGRYIVFQSSASNLVSGDTNNILDAFVFDTSSGTMTRVDVGPNGVEANGAAFADGSSDGTPAVSADGRFVAFVSKATNLVSNDTNGVADVFVRDTQLGVTSRVSVGSDGSQANNSSAEISLSADGRYVAFVSSATNLVPGDTNGFADVFVRDLKTGTTICASVALDGSPANFNSNYSSLSADGRYVAFQSGASNLVADDTNNQFDIFIRDLQTGITTRVTGGNDGTQVGGFASTPSLSSDGQKVAFIAGSTAYVYDVQAKATVNVNVDSAGVGGNGSCERPLMSPDGTTVGFRSFSSNLVTGDANGLADAFLHNLKTGSTILLSGTSLGVPGNGSTRTASLDASGTLAVFDSTSSNLIANDLNSFEDIFIRNVATGVTTRISSAPVAQSSGASTTPTVSADAQRIAFSSMSSNLVTADGNGKEDVFVRDLTAGSTLRVSVSSAGAEGNDTSNSAMISANGKFVVFRSNATNLVANDTNGFADIFVRDLEAGTTVRASVTTNGNEANGSSSAASISADGRFVAFQSAATNLVPISDTTALDVFVRDMQNGTTTLVSVDLDGLPAGGSEPYISADGRYVVFASASSNIVSGDTNGFFDIFVRDLQTNTTSRISLTSAGDQTNGDSHLPVLSADGHFVAFESTALNLSGPTDTNGRQDAFVRDIPAGKTTWVSVSPEGASHNGNTAHGLSLSTDGRYIAFNSDATNLVLGDTNGKEDVYVRDLQTSTTRRVSVSSDNTQAGGASTQANITPDGVFVVFSSTASNLVANDTNNIDDVFRTRVHQPTSLLVYNTLDPIPGDPAIPGSLRFVLQAAQNGDSVLFDDQVFGTEQSNASTVISVFSPLPSLHDGHVNINAKDRRVTVNGTAAGTASGLVINSSNNIVQGLTLTGFTRSGISISSAARNNLIGGDRAVGAGPNGEGLRIANCGAFGIEIAGAGTDSNVVQGCWIGLEASGVVAAQNLAGILIKDGARKNIIGSTSASQVNVIAGNSFEGVTCSGVGTDDNEIIGNIVGSAAVETAEARGLARRDLFVTRSAVGNGSAGIFLSRGTKNSRVGAKDTDDDKTATSVSNLIANNGGNGIEVRASDTKHNSSRRNRITRNNSGGIALFDGSNDGIKPPHFDAVERNVVTTPTKGKANVSVRGSSPNDGTVELFTDPIDQGGTFIGRCSVTGGIWNTVVDISDVENMTATFTDLSGNTSPFAVFGRAPDLAPDGGGASPPSLPGDSDADGIADTLEVLAGTNPADANDKPTAQGAAIMDTFALSLNFAKPKMDALKATLRLSLPPGYVHTGAKLSVLIGSHSESGLVLNSKGISPKAPATVKVVKSVAGSGGKLSFAIAKADLRSDLATSFENKTTVKAGEIFKIPSAVVIEIGGVKYLYVGEIEVLYKATQGKTGKAKNTL